MECQGTVVRPEDGVWAFFNRVYGWMAKEDRSSEYTPRIEQHPRGD